jgi:hypothetical protein
MAAWSVVSRQLVRTTVTGAANVVARTGKPFDQTLAQWALALWVSDLPGFTPLPELRYRSWAFRTTYASLHAQQPNTFAKLFPLAPSVTLGPEVELQGTLRSGSGVYQRVRQPPGRPTFTLQLAGPSGAALPASLAPRLTVIRVR